MPVAKLSTSGSLNAMNSEEGNDSLDTFIREAIGKEPIIPFSRTEDNPVQWIQLLHALDQPDLLGWPLITPVKVQMQKCEKCSQEFCSPINYRRHIRVHRRSLNVYKESHKKRDLLGAFWDKLSVEEAKEVVLFNGVMLKEIPGASVVRGLASSLRKPGVWTLPQVYVRAGSSLVGIIQAKPSRLPISSQELFGILDDTSERTFLCAGTAESVQKYLFDGEAATSILELKNLVASTGFLFEQQLVKAWVADKDAEALRCQKLLVEEEEAAKKRLAELLERKKQKKLRQKEHKLKEQFHRCKGDFNVAIEFDATDRPVLAEASGPPSSSDSSSNSTDVSANVDYCLESLQFQIKKSEEDIEAHIDFSSDCTIEGDSQTIGPPMVGEHGHQHLATSGQQVLNSQRHCHCGCNLSQKIHNSKPECTQKNSLSEKDEIDSNGECLQASLQGGISCKTVQNNCEVIIGSISIPVKQQFDPNDGQGTSGQQLAKLRNTIEKLSICDSVELDTNCIGPVTTGETKGIGAVERGNDEDYEGAVVLKKVGDRIVSGDNHDYVLSGGIEVEGILPFSSIDAKEFLAQRWKEAISADHVQLVLLSGS